MARVARLRLLVDYLDATRNEIAVDEMFLGMARLSPRQVGFFPRVPTWVRVAAQAPLLSRFLWRLTWLGWLSGGALIYFAIEFLKVEILAVRVDRFDGTLKNGAVLAFSGRVDDVLCRPQFVKSIPKLWLTFPWSAEYFLPPDIERLQLLALVSKDERREAFIAAIRATYAMARNPFLFPWVLQSYTAFRWFLVRSAVDRVAGTMVMTNHFDRWAVLIDRSVRARRRQSSTDCSLVLIQHGTLGGVGDSPNSHCALKCLPVRLGCVAKLFAYNSDEESAFRRAVLSDSNRRAPLDVNYFQPEITLSGAPKATRSRILFVGHPLCEEFHMIVYQKLLCAFDFDAFYKPHPRAPMSAAAKNVGWAIISDPKEFPRVELLISYPSTLVIEYGGSGIPSSVHPLDARFETVKEFIAQTLHFLNKPAP